MTNEALVYKSVFDTQFFFADTLCVNVVIMMCQYSTRFKFSWFSSTWSYFFAGPTRVGLLYQSLVLFLEKIKFSILFFFQSHFIVRNKQYLLNFCSCFTSRSYCAVWTARLYDRNFTYLSSSLMCRNWDHYVTISIMNYNSN